MFIQSEANLARVTLNISFVTLISKNFENMITLLLISSFSAEHIKESVRICANVNLRQQYGNKCDASQKWCQTQN